MLLLQAPVEGLVGIWWFSFGEKHPVAGCSGLCAWIPWVSMRWWGCLLWEHVEAKHTWASSIWDSLHEIQGRPISNSTSKQCCIEWQWSPNKMLECCVKIWHVTHAFLWRGWGYITNTREEMLWRHAVGHHNWARKLPVVWKWRTQTQIKLDGHIVGQCFGHI